MLRFQLLNIRKGEAGQTAEAENITHLSYARDVYLLLQNKQKFVLLQKGPFDLFHMNMFLPEWIVFQPSVRHRYADDLFEIFEVLHYGIMSAPAVGFHIELVIFDQLLRQVIQIKIILSVFGPKKLRRNPEKTFIPLNRSRSKINWRWGASFPR